MAVSRIIFDSVGSPKGGVGWIGGRGLFVVDADTWGGGNITLQMTVNGTDWIDVTDITGDTVVGTEASMFNVELPPCDLRMSLVTSTGSKGSLNRTFGGSI